MDKFDIAHVFNMSHKEFSNLPAYRKWFYFRLFYYGDNVNVLPVYLRYISEDN